MKRIRRRRRRKKRKKMRCGNEDVQETMTK
jgi:hypothetical protein